MNYWLLSVIQALLWCGFSIVVWLSHRDHFNAKLFLFLVFSYLAYLIAKNFYHTSKKALSISCINTFLFFSCKYCFSILFFLI